MYLPAEELASMIDISCVRTTSRKADIDEMLSAAHQFGFKHVSVLQSFIPYTRRQLGEDRSIELVGNVSFPSGSDSTSVKVFQAREMAAFGCDELDMVMNIGLLRSGMLEEVEVDINSVIEAAGNLPVKVIIEVMYLTQHELEEACRICVRAGAAFVKTGTGWAERGTSVDDVRRIKAIVGEEIKIKASGGIRELSDLIAMYQAGARRFGINLKSAVEITQQCMRLPSGIEI